MMGAVSDDGDVGNATAPLRTILIGPIVVLFWDSLIGF